MDIQTVTDTAGNKMAFVPLAHYQDLAKTQALYSQAEQDLMDYLQSEATLREIEQTGEEMIPHDIMVRIFLNDENPIRVYRKWRGYTIKQLAHKANMGVDLLGKMERGEREGRISTYRQLAKALHTDIESLLPRLQDD